MSLMLKEIEQQPEVLARTLKEETDSIVNVVCVLRVFIVKNLATTETYTGQLLMFYLLAAALQGGKGLEKLQRIPELAADSLRLKTQIGSMVERYRFMNHCIVVGRGLNYANAYELAIKLMETCYIVCERLSSADLFHRR